MNVDGRGNAGRVGDKFTHVCDIQRVFRAQ